MTIGYRHDLNRFLPAILPGDTLLIPSPELPGKFELLENSGRFASPEVLELGPIARLVEPQPQLPWKAPTVIVDSPGNRPTSDGRSAPPMASDYRYIQQAASGRATLPVLNYETGWIYDLAAHLRAIDLLDYSRILTAAARYSALQHQPSLADA